jgi:hypothetical protein
VNKWLGKRTSFGSKLEITSRKIRIPPCVFPSVNGSIRLTFDFIFYRVSG